MRDQTIDRRTRPAEARWSRWRAPDGWALRRMDWPRQPGSAARGRLLFCGGRGDFIEKYLEPLGHWRAVGWDVTAFDWRGQGESRGDIAGGHLDSLDPLVVDLDALVAAWAGEGAGPRVAIGHSMGGHVLLRLLAERDPPLDAAVLVAPMVAINAAPLPRALAAAIAEAAVALGLGRRPAWRAPAKPPGPGSARQRRLTGCPDRYADELFWRATEPGYSLGAPSWGWLRAAYRSSRRLGAAALARVKPPVLLLAARRDRLVSSAAILRAARHIPDAEAMVLDCAHEILREADPARGEAMARIDAFLDRLGPA